jgi:glyoxylase-like metal-dependent hydrolase (beta-lactamase superfamily II)
MDNATRRRFLKGTAATVAATSIGVSKAVPATSLIKTISHGEFSIIVLSDGHLTIPIRFLARNASDADIKTAIRLNGDLMSPPCNITLVRTPGETILIDFGAGPHYMPGAGTLGDNLEAAGIDRKSITKVVLTHAHPDHLWGLLDDFDDALMFPNASYVMSTTEFEFWMAEDVAARLPEDRRNFAPGAQRNLTSISDRLHPDRTRRGHRKRYPCD